MHEEIARDLSRHREVNAIRVEKNLHVDARLRIPDQFAHHALLAVSPTYQSMC